MAVFLGLDTSNYTTSVAVYDTQRKTIRQNGRLLPVAPGAIGQRQSDAVFGHVKALGGLAAEVLAGEDVPAAIACSVSPRDEAGSYMPCFLAGKMAAEVAAAAAGVPLYKVSHQSGHIVAALFGAGRMELLQEPFLAFHLSGGTTQCLHVEPHPKRVIAVTTLAQTRDLHAGQVVDRVGAQLGLPFPAGPALEALACESQREYQPKPAMKGADCCLSGVENRCAAMQASGEPFADIARYCLCYLRETLIAMTCGVLKQFPGLPLVYAGGVMSNRLLQQTVVERFGGSVAPAQYSADNAAGVALLGALLHERGEAAC